MACFIDGFNLFHAIDNLRDDENNQLEHLKWLDLRSLASAFVPPSTHEITKVLYYSAYATWRPDAYKRHREYVAALEARGVTAVMGRFKEKTDHCNKCGHQWKAHSEKESDVNFSLGMVAEAHLASFDHALIVTADSDQCPTIRLICKLFPRLKLEVLTPPLGYDLANELRNLVPTRKIKLKHLHNNLLPKETMLSDGKVITRPAKFDPPQGHHSSTTS